MMFLRGLIELGHLPVILKRYLLSLLSKSAILTASETEPLFAYNFVITSIFEII
jgi:hypothetical protein